jgi:hypothetical protein
MEIEGKDHPLHGELPRQETEGKKTVIILEVGPRIGQHRDGSQDLTAFGVVNQWKEMNKEIQDEMMCEDHQEWAQDRDQTVMTDGHDEKNPSIPKIGQGTGTEIIFQTQTPGGRDKQNLEGK